MEVNSLFFLEKVINMSEYVSYGIGAVLIVIALLKARKQHKFTIIILLSLLLGLCIVISGAVADSHKEPPRTELLHTMTKANCRTCL